jgi:predicted NAD/FAD-binding protein
MTRIAIIGSGISGLSAAWLLGKKYKVTVFEAGATLGGHTNTVDVTLEGVTHPVDTGFLVYNHATYPNLKAMFQWLAVEGVETEMSFAVSLRNPDLEWAGSTLATVFGQKRNLLRPRFWLMLADILRFNRESVAWLGTQHDEKQTLREFLLQGNYSTAFAHWYLLPMAGAIWSCPTGQMLDTPFATFVRFCQNHGLLQIQHRPKWRTVKGGGREYIKRLVSDLSDIRIECPVLAVKPQSQGVIIEHADGSEHFDQVVLACHSDQALRLLGEHASAEHHAILSAIRYQPNRAVLHTDAALLPRNPALWSAWNYLSALDGHDSQPVSVSYLINKLQPLPFRQPVVVTLNPLREPQPGKVLAEFAYAHPVLDAGAVAAQRMLPSIQGKQGLWFCGAWTGYGFHEDGLKSGLAVANSLGVYAPWQTTPHCSPALHTAVA